MKSIISKVTLILLVVFLAAGNLWAGDSKSFVVRCTIPAVPGVNAPLIEEEKVITPVSPAQEQNRQDAQIETTAKSEQDTSVTVKTIYDR
jgi:hypothetical protein